MRFCDVLKYNKDSGSVSFSFKNLCLMRNVKIEDIEHLGKTIKYLALGANGLVNYRIPFTSLNILIDQKTGNADLVKYNVSDFTIGMCVTIPLIMLSAYIFHKFSCKTYVIIGIGGLCLLSNMK